MTPTEERMKVMHALEIGLESYVARVYPYPDQHDDVCQYIRLTIWRWSARYDPAIAMPSTFAMKFRRFALKDWIRRRLNRLDKLPEQTGQGELLENVVQAEDDSTVITAEECIGMLPAPWGRIMRMIVLERIAQHEVARRLHITRQRVSKVYRISIDRLRELFWFQGYHVRICRNEADANTKASGRAVPAADHCRGLPHAGPL